MFFRSAAIFIVIFFFSNTALGQEEFKLFGGINAGRLIDNHKDFPEIERLAFGTSVGIIQNLNGTQWWHAYYRYPQLGIQAQFVSPGNNDVFGQIISTNAMIRFELGKPRKNPWIFNAAAGLGYITEPFDIVSNEENIILGTRLNNATQLGIEKGTAQIGDHQLFIALSILHLSNAGTHPDNVGLNIPMIAVRTYPKFDKSEIGHPQSSIDFNRSVQVGLRASYGFQQFQAEHGPRYNVYAFNIFGTKLLSPINKVGIGLEGVYSEAVYAFILNQEIVTDSERRNASRLVAYLAHELMFGQLSLYTSLGYYVHHPVLRQKDFSSKIGFQYYFKEVLQSSNQIALGVFVQSYLGSADYLEFGVGYQF